MGPLGCFATGIARVAGAATVIAADINPFRLELAARMGAHTTLNPTEVDVVAAVQEATMGEGVDLVCEMSGHPTALKQALASVRLGGRVHLLGLPKEEISIDLSNDVIFKGITVYGVVGRRIFETWHQMRKFLASGLFDPTPVITHCYPLDGIDDALQAIRSGQAGKVILEIGG